MSGAASLIVPAGKVTADLSDFVVRVDLADMPDEVWDACDGENLRIRSAGSDVPFDVVAIDTGARTGELFFRASLSSGAANVFLVEAIDGATAPAATDTNGRNAVWADYDAMVHFSELVDRTGASHPVSTVGALIAYYTKTQEIDSSVFQQGVAWDGTYWYGTGGGNNRTLAKFNTSGVVQATVTDLSAVSESTFGHIGGCVVVGGELFVTVSDYPSRGRPQVIVVNLSDLSYNRDYPIDDVSEPADICWNSDDSVFTVVDYDDPETLHTYDATFTTHGTLTLPGGGVSQSQGIEWSGGYYFIQTGPQSTPSTLYRVADDMTGSMLGMYTGSLHNQGLASKVHNTATPDLWIASDDGDLDKLTYGAPAVTPELGWLTLGGGGNALITSLPKRTQWTMGATARLSQVPGGNYAVLSYSENSNSNTARATMAARDAPDQWAIWNSTADSWLSGTAISSGDVGVRRRLHHTQNATTDRKLWRNGVVDATDTGVNQRPAGGSDGTMALFIGAEDTTYSERFRGSLNYVYLRNGVLSADWLAAEQASWEGADFHEWGAAPEGLLLTEFTGGAPWSTYGTAETDIEALADAAERIHLLTELGDAETPGTRVTGGSYAALTPSWSIDEDSGRAAWTPAATTLSNMPAADVVGFELWDAADTVRAGWGYFLPEPLAYADAATNTIVTENRWTQWFREHIADGGTVDETPVDSAGLRTNDLVIFHQGACPPGLTPHTKYYVRDVTRLTFKVAATRDGSALDITADADQIGWSRVLSVIAGTTIRVGRIELEAAGTTRADHYPDGSLIDA